MVDSLPEDCKDQCKTEIKECGNQKECEEQIMLMDYNNMTLMYSDEDYDSNSKLSKTYLQFLNATLSTMNSCGGDNSVLLLTNRIVFMDINNDFQEKIEATNIKFKIILLGSNDTNSTEDLKTAYANFPNVTTLSFANFDCLNYLLYCILPCSDTVIECVRSDLEDCHDYSALTPNKNPEQTLHIWFIIAFANINDQNLELISIQIFQGIQSYIDAFGVQSVRFRFLFYNDDIDETCEYIDSLLVPCQTVDALKTNITVTGFPIGDDGGITNQRLSLVPWSDALTKTRIGISSVILLTDFATPNLITFNHGSPEQKKKISINEMKNVAHDDPKKGCHYNGIQNLLAQIYVYNFDAYKYYFEKYKNSTDIHVSLLNWSDAVTIVPINNGGPLPTTPDFYKTSTTTLISTKGQSSTTVTSAATTTNSNTQSTATSLIKNKRYTSSSQVKVIIFGSLGGIVMVVFVGLFIFWRRKVKQRSQRRKQFLYNFVKGIEKLKTTALYDEWQLVWNQITIKDVIGSGAYGQILLGSLQSRDLGKPDCEVAIKMPSKVANEEIKKQFLYEVNLMKQISGQKNIIKMLGCITAEERMCIVLEFCENSDLLKYVKKLKKNRVVENEIEIHRIFLQFIMQITEGLQFLTTKNIIHRDLAARNVLIDGNKNAKITDFGLSIQVNEKTSLNPDLETIKLPLKWMAIESLKNYEFSFKTDIWTFGIVIFEMYSFGESPHADIVETEFIEYLEKNNRLAKPDFCPNEIYAIMMKCWPENPNERSTADELLKTFTNFFEQFYQNFYGYFESGVCVLSQAESRCEWLQMFDEDFTYDANV